MTRCTANRLLLSFACLATLLTLAACNSRDPYLRTDVWEPTGANDANIGAMVANPHDLISGRGSPVQNAGEPALAVGHIWTDQPKPLNNGSSSSSGSGGSNSAGGIGGGGGGGGGSGS